MAAELSFKMTELYGGAITAEIPEGWLDSR